MNQEQIDRMARHIKAAILKEQQDGEIQDSPLTRYRLLKKYRDMITEDTELFPGHFIKNYLWVLDEMMAEQGRMFILLTNND